MSFFGIELFDGKILSGFPLELDEPLVDQWACLGEDIANVVYDFRGMTICMDISWYGNLEDVNNPNNRFVVDVAEWGRDEFKVFYRAVLGADLYSLKEAMQKAIDLIQSFRILSFEEIDAFPDLYDKPKR